MNLVGSEQVEVSDQSTQYLSNDELEEKVKKGASIGGAIGGGVGFLIGGIYGTTLVNSENDILNSSGKFLFFIVFGTLGGGAGVIAGIPIGTYVGGQKNQGKGRLYAPFVGEVSALGITGLLYYAVYKASNDFDEDSAVAGIGIPLVSIIGAGLIYYMPIWFYMNSHKANSAGSTSFKPSIQMSQIGDRQVIKKYEMNLGFKATFLF